MKIAILSSVAWRTPPNNYGPWEQVASNVAEGLVALGMEVTLFATGDSSTSGKLEAAVASGYEENPGTNAKVCEYLHIANLMEKAQEFDLIHNHFDFMPLAFSRLIKTPMLTTIHGFSSPSILPIYQKYNDTSHYAAISDADRSPLLRYAATVYNGLDTSQFTFCEKPKGYLLFFGRIHPDKGTSDAIQIARRAGARLVIAGLVQDSRYFEEAVLPFVDDDKVVYLGNVGPTARDRLLGNALALLHPIHFEEPFGLSVVEAMLCGTPVIAYNKGAMPEIIKNGETGFLVNNIEEAVAVVGQVSKLRRSACHQHAKDNFSKEKMALNYLAVYEAILGSDK